jgi:ATPase subunit of ABC transporter with duplicated ATPase domains
LSTVLEKTDVSDFADEKRNYELQLRAMSDDQLRAEFADVRRRYSPLRTELTLRKLAMRERRSTKIEHLIGAVRMRAAVAKYMKQDEPMNRPTEKEEERAA